MPTRKSPRKGSLQFWPRKRAKKLLPSVNWNAISDSSKNLKGFIVYKAGMGSALVKDNTPNSVTKDREIITPVTILECPLMKIFSIRLYKNKKVAKEILNKKKIEKELKKRVKIPKKELEKIQDINIEDYEDISIICYNSVKNTGIKKKPDLAEIGLKGSLQEKFEFIKENLEKDLSITDFFEKGNLVDLRGLTKGKGFSGPVKRFGIQLKDHKSEKGRRRPGSIGPWHPARVIFRVPMAGQLGMFTRVIYNNKIIDIGKINNENKELFSNIKNYGNLKTDYIIVKGSVQGPAKRQLVLTSALRPSKKTKKLNYNLLKIIK
ncbi:MAG: 50S ribosomal protein L3 [Nanoarchaeota archaeon]